MAGVLGAEAGEKREAEGGAGEGGGVPGSGGSVGKSAEGTAKRLVRTVMRTDTIVGKNAETTAGIAAGLRRFRRGKENVA